MNLLEWLAAEGAQDPIWLRTLATVLPVVGTVVVGIVAAPWLVEKVKQNRNPTPVEKPAEPETPRVGLPAPVAIEATERAQADPLLRLLIEDLHSRLSEAHKEAAELHLQRATDAATIARLTADLEDKDERLAEVEREFQDKATQNRLLKQKISQLRNEVDMLNRRLSVALAERDDYDSRSDSADAR